MANNCYNLIAVWGNEQALSQVRKWNELLDSVAVDKEDVHRMGAIRKVFYPEVPSDQPVDYGSKWVHADASSTGSDEESLGFQSAWKRPEELEKRIACLLFKLDPNVVLRNIFNIDDGTEGVAYTTPKNELEAVSVEASASFNFDDLDEDDIADEEDSRRGLLREEEIDLITDMMYEYPHTRPTFKSHQLELDLDDEYFEDQ